MKHGAAMITFTNGGKFEGNFENGDKCGEGKLTFPNGDNIEASYSNDMLNGPGVFNKGGEAIECVWYDDVKIQLKTDKDGSDRMGCAIFLQMLLWLVMGMGVFMYTSGDVEEITTTKCVMAVVFYLAVMVETFTSKTFSYISNVKKQSEIAHYLEKLKKTSP